MPSPGCVRVPALCPDSSIQLRGTETPQHPVYRVSPCLFGQWPVQPLPRTGCPVPCLSDTRLGCCAFCHPCPGSGCFGCDLGRHGAELEGHAVLQEPGPCPPGPQCITGAPAGRAQHLRMKAPCSPRIWGCALSSFLLVPQELLCWRETCLPRPLALVGVSPEDQLPMDLPKAGLE